ncbi:MAG TPA: TIGR03086 family metal-binding protein [Acidimicrobiales bacterium]
MSSHESNYLRVAHGFTNSLASVKDGQWQLRTPCDDWDVTDLVEHVVATHQRVYTMINPGGIEGLDPEALLSARWIYALRTYQDALNDSEISNAPVTTRVGEQPFFALVEGLLMIDTLCHSWDLARAIGSDEWLDPIAVDAAHEKLISFGDGIRVPGGFKDAVTPRSDADEQTKFLNFAGRIV